MRRTFLRVVAAALLLCPAAHTLAQQRYPDRPVRIIIPFAPGGGTDIVARVIAQPMSSALGQSVVIDNRPGAGGSLGEEMIARATPDGYTLGMVSGYGTNAAIYKLTYDQVTDIQAVAAVGESGMIVALHPAVPVKSVHEFVAYARANPRKLNYGSSGTGALAHLAVELMDLLAGVRTSHIPFKGTGPALTALLSKEVDFIFGSMPSTTPHIAANRLRGVAVTTPKRWPTLPELPALGESVKGYLAVITYGLIAPRGVRPEALQRWNSEINKLIQSREMKERLARDGLEPVGGAPQVFHDVIKRDVEQWKRVVKEAKLSFAS